MKSVMHNYGKDVNSRKNVVSLIVINIPEYSFFVFLNQKKEHKVLDKTNFDSVS